MENAKKDYTLGLYGEHPIDLYECIGAGSGSYEISHKYYENDRCKRIRKGFNHKDGDPIKDDPGQLDELHKDIMPIDDLLEDNLIELYTNLDNMPYIDKK